MIPLKLTLEGLYSYQERQTIDFTELTQAGLFGIFGSVGSGKSSILEAISYALYGETERLNARDKRSYNMLNLKSDKAYIEFEFENHEGRKFKATKEFKRNSKNFEDIKTPVSVLYEFLNNKWIPMESSNVEGILGLSYENFKRTIIIPQGQFKEFLELGDTERTRMMKEIFNLHQYDLQDKVARLNKENTAQLNQLQGQLIGFETISEEIISEQKLNLGELQKELEQQEIRFKEVSERFQFLKNLQADFELLEKKRAEFDQISTKKEEILRLEEKLIHYEKTHQLFFNSLQQAVSIEKELQAKKLELTQQKEVLTQIETETKLVEEKLRALQPEFENLDLLKRKEVDFQLIGKIKEHSQKIQELKSRIEKGSTYVSDLEKQLEEKQKQIEQKESEADKFAKTLIDPNILLEISQWFQRQNSLLEDQQKIEKLQKSGLERIQAVENELSEEGIQLDLYYLQSDEWLGLWEEKSKELESQRAHFALQEKLSEYSQQLVDGEPCPLCGSLDHPQILETENVSEHLASVLKDISEHQKSYENWRKTREKVEQAETKIRVFQEDINRLNEEAHLNETLRKAHLDQFQWTNILSANSTEFESIQNQQIKTSQLIQEFQLEIKELRTKNEENRTKLDTYKKSLDEFKQEESTKLGEINSLVSQLKELRLVDFETSELSEIQSELEFHSKEISRIENNYTELQKSQQSLVPRLSSQKTLVETSEKRIQEIESEQQTIQHHIQENLKNSRYANLDQVHQILSLNLNIETTRKEIQDFKIGLETLINSIKELEVKLAGKSLSAEEFEAEKLKLQEVEIAKKSATEEVAKQTAEISRLEKEFATKAGLLKELAQLQKREENLKTMFNLFKGAGFVQYVSSIYLRQLCDNANVRFHRMTRNQLSLQLNENNNFEIIDYLNEGRSRSVKTLSGGQAFQASLSLALALAESVQSQAKSEKNFFFIDEGFGTQDSDSVNIVFETLTSLQKESRIVGIISHVEELKERIPMALSIRKDEQRGSLIEIL